jgi:hypothetical protein
LEYLGALRTCFERIAEWDGRDVAARALVFSVDLTSQGPPGRDQAAVTDDRSGTGDIDFSSDPNGPSLLMAPSPRA